MDSVEKLIIEYLQQGMAQYEISERLKENGIKPNSLSSVEKRLNKIKDFYNAKTLFHLACILYNQKIISNPN
ncbi:response regulator, partial [Chryseobacterium arthrosphaerae]